MIDNARVSLGFFASIRDRGFWIFLAVAFLTCAVVVDNSEAFFWLIGLIGIVVYALLAHFRPFAAFIILVFAASTEGLSRIEVMSGISIMVGLGVIFTLVWALRLATRQSTLVLNKKYLILLGLAGTVLLSMAVNLGGPAGHRPVFTYLQQILLVLIVLNFVTSEAKLNAMGRVFVLSSCLIAIFMIANYFDWIPEGIARTITGHLPITAALRVTYTRIGGLFGDPNFTAAQLTTGLSFVIAWWLRANSRRERLLLLAAGGVILAGFSLTISIGGFLGLLTILFIHTAFTGSRNFLVKGCITVLITFVFIQGAMMLFPDVYQQRILENKNMIIDLIETRDYSLFLQLGTYRGDTWQAAWQAFNEAPLLGHGPGAGMYVNAPYLYFGQKMLSWAHNMFLTIAVELGLLGLSFFAFMLSSGIRAVRPRAQTHNVDPSIRATRNAVFAALVACVVQGFAIDLHVIKLPWLLLGMGIAFGRLSTHVGRVVSQPTHLSEKDKRSGLVL